jgi:hypothetical protein
MEPFQEYSEKKYFYTNGQSQFGPFTYQELGMQGITPATQVWYQGLENWTAAGSLPELAGLFAAANNTATPPPTSGYYGGNFNDGNTLDAGVNAPPPQNPYQQAPPYGERPPKNWLVESILTLCCCWPFSIAAIVNAAKVESRWYAGDYDGAYRAADEAKKWTMISFWVGIVFAIIRIIIMVGTTGSRYDAF